MVHWTNHTPTPHGRRPIESPRLWVSLVIGSLLVHVLFFLSLRFYLMRTVKVAVVPAPITIDFVPDSSRRAAPQRRPRSATNPSTLTTRAATNERRSPPATANGAIAPPDSADNATLVPSTDRPSFSQPAKRVDPITPPPSRPRRRPSRSPADTAPDSPQPQKPPDRRQRPPAATSPPVEPPLNGTHTATDPGTPEQSDDQGPIGSGVGLPPTQAGTATVQVVGEPYQVQDIKDRAAKPRLAYRELAVPYPGANTDPIELRVQLEIDEKGRVVLPLLDIKLLNSNQAIAPERLQNLAERIFTDWEFEPAYDRKDDTTLEPTRSDLFLEIKITWR